METPPDTSQPPKRRGFPLAIAGALAALAAGLGAAWMLVGQGGEEGRPPAAEGGLVIDATGPDDGPVEPGKLLRCFVQGQYVGELNLTDCAQRNGVATDALDVGLDESGVLAAAEQAADLLTPLPPLETDPSAEFESALPADEAEPLLSLGACWRHGSGRWRKLAGDSDLDTCVQTLFAGRCERAGGASYGRFGRQTLRLVAGRVEVSDDNRTFRNLVSQAPDCSIPPVGRG